MAVSENQSPEFGSFPSDSWAFDRFPIKGGVHLYRYTLCYIHEGGLTDQAVGDFAGLVVNEYDATQQPDGGLWATVLLFVTVKLPGSEFKKADFGKPAYGLDNFTASSEGTHRIGTIKFPVGPSEAWIALRSVFT